MNRFSSFIVAAAIFSGGVHGSRANDVFAPQGQPFCLEKEKLQEMVLALVKKDIQWLESLDGCILLKQRAKFAVIEEYEGSDLGHVVKGRVFGVGGSFVAYTLSIGLDGLKGSK